MRNSKKRIVWVGITLVAIVMVVSFVPVLAVPLNTEYSPSFKQKNYQNIEKGMVKEQVNALIGESFGVHVQGDPVPEFGTAYCESYSRPNLQVPPLWGDGWWAQVLVCYSKNDIVEDKAINTFFN